MQRAAKAVCPCLTKMPPLSLRVAHPVTCFVGDLCCTSFLSASTTAANSQAFSCFEVVLKSSRSWPSHPGCAQELLPELLRFLQPCFGMMVIWHLHATHPPLWSFGCLEAVKNLCELVPGPCWPETRGLPSAQTGAR